MIPFRSPSYIEQMKFKVMGTRVLLTLSLILGSRSVTWEWDKSRSFILAIGTVTRDPQTIYCRKKGGSSKRFSYNLCNLLGLIYTKYVVISVTLYGLTLYYMNMKLLRTLSHSYVISQDQIMQQSSQI